jgi:transcriptional regulator with XRE-family HTH domain
MFYLDEGLSAQVRSARLGARLRALRLQRNLTQADLASRAGISRPTLAALEREGAGSLETLASVLYALGREAELEAIGQPDPAMSLEDVVAPKRVRQRARP